MAELEELMTIEIQATQKLTLGELNESIQTKKVEGEKQISLEKIRLQDYDIRKERNVEAMMQSIVQSTQLKPITLSYSTKDEMYDVVDGRTRFSALEKLHESSLKMRYKTANASIYNDLTILEQNYLNATTNANQKPLTTDEKLSFIERHKDELDDESLAKALNVVISTIRTYNKITQMLEDNPEVRQHIKQIKKGHGRGELDIDMANVLTRVKDDNAQLELAKEGAKVCKERHITDKAKYNFLSKKVKQVNTILEHKEELDLTSKEVVELVVESEDTNAGLISPENSYEKFNHFKQLLEKESFDEIIFDNVQSPKMLNTPDGRSMAKITLDHARQHKIPITLIDASKNTCDLWKAKEGIDVVHKYIEQFLETDFHSSKNKTLMVWHLAGNRNARELLDARILRDIGIIRPKTTLVFILTEEFTTPSCEWSDTLERIRTFGILKGKQLKNMEIESYFNAIEAELQNKVKFTIVWEKQKQRRVALIRADFSVDKSKVH